MKLELSQITVDFDLSFRDKIDWAVVKRYQEAVAHLPPLVVTPVDDGEVTYC